MKLLEKLTTTAAVPGREKRIREVILKQIEGLFDQVQVDPLGSIIAVRKPRPGSGKGKKQPTRVMLAAHMDQIGFLVRYIDEKGFLRVQNVGGFDPRNLFARLVTVCTEDDGDLPGVLNPSGRPLHMASEEEKKKIPEVTEFAVDLGLDVEQVKKKVRIGDMVVMSQPFAKVGRTVVSQALDNRVACWLVIRAIEKLKAHDCEIHCVFTVQEEVGLRGAITSAYAVKPDIGLGVDTTLCVDTPGVGEDQAVTKQGAGAALTVMDAASIGDVGLLKDFERLAKKHKIKTQRSILGRGGTDSGAIQRAGAGVRTLTLSCPTRYIHTVTEMVSVDDLHACRDLLAVFLGM